MALKTMFKITGNAMQYIEQQGRKVSKEHSTALAAVGYRLKETIKKGMRAEAPGGEKWPPLHPWTRYGIIRLGWQRYKRGMTAKKESTRKKYRDVRVVRMAGQQTTALRRLSQAVRYQRWKNQNPDGSVRSTKVRIGFISPGSPAEKIMSWHAAGKHTLEVTPRKRRMLFAMGIGTKIKAMTTPRRSAVEPVFRKNEHKIYSFIDQRIHTVLIGGDPKSLPNPFS